MHRAIALWVILGCAGNEQELPTHSCNRAEAREARKALNEMLLPLARSLGAQLTRACPLNKEHDRFLSHESQKKAINMATWRCGICGKSFRSEYYIDMHLDRKHMDTLSPEATTCLADFCDILRCPSWIKRVRAQLRANPMSCREAELESRRHLCQHLLHDCLMADNTTVRLVMHQFPSEFPNSCLTLRPPP